MSGFTITAVLLGLIVIYFRIRLHLDQRRLIDFQQQYHRTMTPLQIRKSRRFFFKSEVQKSPHLRRLRLAMQLGNWGVIAGLVIVAAEMIGITTDSGDDQLWFTLTWAFILIAASLTGITNWLLNRALFELTAPDPEVNHVDLTTTPTVISRNFSHHHVGYVLSLVLLLLTLTIGSVTETVSPSVFGRSVTVSPFGIGLRFSWHSRQTSTAKTPTTMTDANTDTTTTSNSQTTSSRTSSAETSSQTTASTKSEIHTRAFKDAAFVQTLPSTKQRYLTEQDQLALISMYYLAITHGDPAGFENDPGAKFFYHRISNYAPTTYILQRQAINGHKTFEYLAQINDDNQIHLYHFNNPDGQPTELHQLVPKYTEFPNSSVKLGQLVTGYYSEQDGPYHRTMWAMQPGQAWQY